MTVRRIIGVAAVAILAALLVVGCKGGATQSEGKDQAKQALQSAPKGSAQPGAKASTGPAVPGVAAPAGAKK